MESLSSSPQSSSSSLHHLSNVYFKPASASFHLWHLSPLSLMFTCGLNCILVHLQVYWILIFTFLAININWFWEGGSSSGSNCINLWMDFITAWPQGQHITPQQWIHINYNMISNIVQCNNTIYILCSNSSLYLCLKHLFRHQHLKLETIIFQISL